MVSFIKTENPNFSPKLVAKDKSVYRYNCTHLEYVTSNYGGQQLLWNKYVLTKNREKNGIIHWRCRKTIDKIGTRCTVTLNTQQQADGSFDVILPKVLMHNHPPQLTERNNKYKK